MKQKARRHQASAHSHYLSLNLRFISLNPHLTPNPIIPTLHSIILNGGQKTNRKNGPSKSHFCPFLSLRRVLFSFAVTHSLRVSSAVMRTGHPPPTAPATAVISIQNLCQTPETVNKQTQKPPCSATASVFEID